MELRPVRNATLPFLLVLPALLVFTLLPCTLGGARFSPAAIVATVIAVIGWAIGWYVIGARQVVIDGEGIEQRGALGRRRITWRDAGEYRYWPEGTSTVESPRARLGLLSVFGPIALVARRLQRGRLRVRGGGQTVTIDVDRYGAAGRAAIAQVIARIEPAIASRLDAELAETGAVRFGPLVIGRDAITWARRAPLPRADVEAVELFETEPVRLRVMARGKVWPYGSAEAATIPNALVALAIARRLGYPVPDRGTIEPIQAG